MREIMLASFAEYDSVLKVPSSAMWESVEDVAGHIALGGAVLARVGSESVGSGRYELREEHVYIGRVSVLPGFRNRGISTSMMQAMESRAAAAGRTEARISVRVLLPRNISLYERLGYVIMARYQHERGDEMIVDMAKRI